MHLIDQVSIADSNLLHEDFVFVIQLTLPRENNFFIELVLKFLDLSLNSFVDLSAKLFVESVCDKIGVSLALLDEIVR